MACSPWVSLSPKLSWPTSLPVLSREHVGGSQQLLRGGLSPHFPRQVLQPPSPPPAPGDSGLLPFLSPASPRMWPVPQSLGTAVLELGLVSQPRAGVRGPRAAPTPRPPASRQHLRKEENRQPQGKQARVRLSPAAHQVALLPAPEPAGGAGSPRPEVAARGSVDARAPAGGTAAHGVLGAQKPPPFSTWPVRRRGCPRAKGTVVLLNPPLGVGALSHNKL